MTITTFLAHELLDHAFRNSSYTPPATVHLALFTAAPTVAGGGTEVSAAGTAYARQAIAFNVAASRAIVQTAAEVFPEATGGGFGTVTHWGVFDASTGGNLLAFGALTTSQAVPAGVVATVPLGEVTITFNT
jgi:hypothetical protein